MKLYPDIRLPLLFMLILIVLSICLIVLLPATTEAQNTVRILQTDRLEGISTSEEGRIRKLIGNVRLETDDFTILCDSAWQFLDLEELQAYGNIEIVSDRERIWSDKATYDLKSEISLFEGRVIMQSKNTLLFSDEVYYSFATEIALFPDYLRLEDDRGVLVADSGYYYNALDSAIFRGHVQVTDSLQYIEADSIFTKRADEHYELHGQVFLDDQQNQTRLTGAYVLSDSTGYRKVEGGSLMRQINESETDTTYLWSDWLEVIPKEDTIRTFTAYEAVHIWTRSYSSLSDTTHYDEATDQFTLSGESRLWYDEMQLSGPYIRIQIAEDSVRYLEAHNRPFAVQNDTIINRFNQITGDTIYMHFEGGKISYLDVYPRGNVLYFLKDPDQIPDGMIDLTAEFIKLLFYNGELEDVIARRNVDGVHVPEHQGVANRKLDGFIWEPELRPQRPLNRILPRFNPVPEERPFEMPHRFLNRVDSVEPEMQQIPN
ncbi:MAG: OstA-like protein [Balneolales bacterium]